MSIKLNEALQRAGALTRNGRLAEATAAIQQMLSRSLPPGLHRGLRTLRDKVADIDTVDVEARTVDEPSGDENPRAHSPSDVGADFDISLPAPGGFAAGHFANAAGQRDYKLYRPRRQPEGHAPALVVMLHGCTQDPDDFAAGTRMNEWADARGWWVLYPAQSSSANGSGCWNWFKPADQQRTVGEPAIIAGMTLSLVEPCGIDPARIFVAGLSAGGAMAVTLAATHPELFAAVGVHSGLPHGSAHDLMSALTAMRQGAAGSGSSPHHVPTIVFHGDQDNTVHPCNGTEVIRQARRAPGPLSAQAEAGPFEEERAGVPNGHTYTRTLHRNADNQVDAEHWVIHGAGHAWSGGSNAGSYTDPLGPDASNEMLRFFDQQKPT